MQSWKIFTHSLRMIFDNLGPALKISAVLYTVQFITVTYFFLSYGDFLNVMNEFTMNTNPNKIPPEIPAGFAGSMVLSGGVFLFTSLWIAVSWHRYILYSESPSAILPSFHANEVTAYFGKIILLGIVLVAVFIAAVLVAGLIFRILAPVMNETTIQFLAGILTTISVIYFSYRFGPVLPAAALAKPLPFREAWEKTASTSGTILLLALIIVAFRLLVQIPSNLNPDPASMINLAYGYVLGWIVMLLGVSILTTLYGIYIEGREI